MSHEDVHLLTTAEVAERFRVNPGTVQRWVREGRLKATRPAGSRLLRFTAEDIEAAEKASTS